MPLPRFHRLPAERQREILDIAQRVFAVEGFNAGAFGAVVSACGFSKATAYHYFDGKDDLVDSVLSDVFAQMQRILGVWADVASAPAFWAQLEATSERLRAHLHAHPHAARVLGRAVEAGRGDAGFGAMQRHWFEAVVHNGQRVGEIRCDLDDELLIAVSMAAFGAIDAWALARMADPAQDAGRVSAALSLVRGMWAPPG